jgi:branched-chain amino acid transport system ATP-binding protein
LLTAKGIEAGYGRVTVVSDVGFEIDRGEIVAMVGRNGVGKTTSLFAAAGVRYGPGKGTVILDGKDISHAAPHKVVANGLKLVPEGRRVFREMSVLQNLRLGAFLRRRSASGDIERGLEEVYQLFPVLRTYKDQEVISLSGGQQQMVAVGQALMSKPSFLMLDEPTAGLAPLLVDSMYEAFAELAGKGLGLLIVDQNVERVFSQANRFYVVESGSVIAEGKCSEPGALDRVRRIVLGVEGHSSINPLRQRPRQ